MRARPCTHTHTSQCLSVYIGQGSSELRKKSKVIFFMISLTLLLSFSFSLFSLSLRPLCLPPALTALLIILCVTYYLLFIHPHTLFPLNFLPIVCSRNIHKTTFQFSSLRPCFLLLLSAFCATIILSLKVLCRLSFSAFILPA